jgi:glycoside/pentoside/hexuronide:cation symporter, GPH family
MISEMSQDKTIGRLPLYQAFIYASGYFGVQLIGFAVGQIPQIFYIPEEGIAKIADLNIWGKVLLGGYLFGLVNALGRIIDALIDPVIANRSDYLKSRFGRRKPFILVGAPLMGLALILFTLPPTHTPSIANLIYLAIIYPIFFIFFAVAVTPYLAILPEVTPTSLDRLLVTTLQSIFLIAGTFTGVVLVGMIPEKISFTSGAMLIGALACIPFFLVVFFVHPPGEMLTEDIPERPSTIVQVKEALAFKPFRIYLLGQVAFWFGFKMVESSARYVAVHLFGDRHAYTIILGSALLVAALSGVMSYHLGKRLGKKRCMVLMSLMFMILMPLIGLIGWGPFKPHIVGYLLFALIGIPLSLLFVIPNSLLSDIIDRNREQTGKQRQALFFAAQALLDKTGIAVSQLALNFLLPIGAIVTSEGVRAVGENGVRLVGPSAAVFILIGLMFFLKLPDVEKR